ncbi:CHAT domain-containing protein [Amycolatopsis sp. cmx-11-51]|uniref:CHAT domain-containing protein n=1 Tax=Amycolatopsis sp. cmx-11-51 TaxID=2785797 RepID=UPI0039E3210E
MSATAAEPPDQTPANRWEQLRIELTERIRRVESDASDENPLPLLWRLALAAANDNWVSRALVHHRQARRLFVERGGQDRDEAYVAAAREATGSFSAIEVAHADRALAYHLSDVLGFTGLVPQILSDAEAVFRGHSDDWGLVAVLLDAAHIVAVVARTLPTGSDKRRRGAEMALRAVVEALNVCERINRFSVRLHAILHTHGSMLGEVLPVDVLAALGRTRRLASVAPASTHETEDGRDLVWGMPLSLDALVDAMPGVIDEAWIITGDPAATSTDRLLPAARYFAGWVQDGAAALASRDDEEKRSADHQIAVRAYFAEFFGHLLALPPGRHRWGGVVRPAKRDSARQSATTLAVASLEKALDLTTTDANLIIGIAAAARRVLADAALDLGLEPNAYIVAYLGTLDYCANCVASGRPELIRRLLTEDATVEPDAVTHAAGRLVELGHNAREAPHTTMETFAAVVQALAEGASGSSADETIHKRLRTFVTPELELLRSQWDRADRADDRGEFGDAYWLTAEVRDLAWTWLEQPTATVDGGDLDAMTWNDVALWCHHAAVEAVWLARKAGLNIIPAVRSCRRVLAAESHRLGTTPQLLLEAQLVWLRLEHRVCAADRPVLRKLITGDDEVPDRQEVRAALRFAHETFDPDEPVPLEEIMSGRQATIDGLHGAVATLREAIGQEGRPNRDELAATLVRLAGALCQIAYEKRAVATELDRDGKPLRALRIMASMRDAIAELADIDPQTPGLEPLAELQETLDHLVCGYAADTAMLAARENYRREQEITAARDLLTRHLSRFLGDANWTLPEAFSFLASTSTDHAQRWRTLQLIDLLAGKDGQISAAIAPTSSRLGELGNGFGAFHEVLQEDVQDPLIAARALVVSEADDLAGTLAAVLTAIDECSFTSTHNAEDKLRAARMYRLLVPLLRLANAQGMHEEGARLAAGARTLHPDPDDITVGAHDLVEAMAVWNTGDRRRAMDLADSGIRRLVLGAEKLRRPDAREQFLGSVNALTYGLTIGHHASKDATLPDAAGRLLAMMEALNHDYTARLVATNHQPTAWATTSQLADRIGWLDAVPYPDPDQLLSVASGHHVLAYRLAPDARSGFRLLVRPDGSARSDEIRVPDALLTTLGEPPWHRLNDPDEIDRLTMESPRALAELADLLLPVELREVPNGEPRQLFILLHDQLWHVPFAALPIGDVPLITCWCPILTTSLRTAIGPHDDDHPLADAPVVGHLRDPNLAGATTEQHVLESFASAGRITLLQEETARMAREAVRDSDLLVIAAHGEGTGPRYSLRFPDSAVTLADIARWGRVPKDVIALACLSGRRSSEPFPLGLVGILRSLGARTVVSGLWELPDMATASGLETIVEQWTTGMSIAEAVRWTQQRMFDLGYPPSRWAGLITAR